MLELCRTIQKLEVPTTKITTVGLDPVTSISWIHEADEGGWFTRAGIFRMVMRQ